MDEVGNKVGNELPHSLKRTNFPEAYLFMSDGPECLVNIVEILIEKNRFLENMNYA